MDQPVHEMTLETTHGSGAQEWYCPTCGRRFLMQWPPEFKKIVLEPGDEDAAHTGMKGDFQVEADALSEEQIQIPERSLRFWQKALEELHLDDTGSEP